MFKAFKIILRLTLILFIVCFAALSFSARNIRSEIEALPDYDYRAKAEYFWQKNRPESALACLEYYLQNNVSDKAACELLYNNYLSEIKKSKSAYGRIYAVGKGFITGNVESLESLGGSVAGDLLVYGDIRDIVKESFINDESDKFILAMSGVGLITTFWPPADPAPALLKAAKKTKSLSEPLQEQFVKSVKLLSDSKFTKEKKVEEIQKNLMPIVELGKDCKTWSEFSLIMKNSENVGQISKIRKLLKADSKNAKKIEQILVLSGSYSKEAFTVIDRYGQRGLDFAYSVLAKGPKGISILAKHPAAFARLGKNTYKASPVFLNFLEDEFTKYISAYGEIFRWSLLFILSLAFVFLLLPFKKIWGSVADLSGGKNIIFRTFNFFIFYLLLALVLFALVCGAFFYLKKEKTEAPNYSELELAKWSEITWQIDLKIDEDKFINESLSITINAPALVIEGKRYLVCDFEKLGLNWKEITKGGVYNLSCTASQRKLNLSFKVQKLLVTGENLNIVLIELPILETESLKLLTASQKVNLNSIRLFSAKNSYRNADLDLSVNGKSIRLNKGGEAGDSLITKNGFYLGLLERDEKSLIAKYLEAEILNEAKQEIPLLKKENEVYYVDFMCRVSDIKKSLK